MQPLQEVEDEDLPPLVSHELEDLSGNELVQARSEDLGS